MKEHATIAAMIGLLIGMAMTPTVAASHDPDYADGGGPQALDDVATDGYVVVAERVENGFDVQVLHVDGTGLFGGDAVTLANPDTWEPGSNTGAWLHDNEDPTNGQHPAQDLSLSADGTTLQVRNIDASGLNSVVFVVPVTGTVADDAQGWVAGFYHAAQTEVPADALDAVPYPVML